MNRTSMITLDLPPVGIKLLDKKTIGLYNGVKLFYGVSYCEAIFEATFGKELLLRPETIPEMHFGVNILLTRKAVFPMLY